MYPLNCVTQVAFPSAPGNYHSILCFYKIFFLNPHISDNKWYQTVFIFLYLVYFTSFTNAFQIYPSVANGRISFFSMGEGDLIVYIPQLYVFFVHLSNEGHISAITNNAAININVQISPWDSHFNSYKYVLRSGIARSYSSLILNLLPYYFP